MTEYRVEHDLLGERNVPADAYYGVHTLRAKENFQISGVSISKFPYLISALASIKQAAAEANYQLGLLSKERRDAIESACIEIREGRLHDQFVVDIIQGGAGTSTNMNANEVICNRALEILGHERGQYDFLHPNEHVNLAQSTNDVYPTALRIATSFAIEHLIEAMGRLHDAFEEKAVEFAGLLKLGRTQLQDAVPMTLGLEFSAFATMVEEDMARLKEADALIREINLGATAIGTGINSHPEYAGRAVETLKRITGIDLSIAPNLIEATQDCGAFVQISGVLKRIAVKLSKTCNDLRLLASGPRAGFGEINLPPMQAGSSIMPGKVNPVIPEVVNQVAFEVFGNDITVTFAAEAGQLQLNAFEPIIAASLFRSFNHLTAASVTLADKCVKGITANPERMREAVERSTSLATALNPYIGYKLATSVAREAHETGATVRQVVLSKQLMTSEKLDEALRPDALIKPRVY
ncbi:aspartate ammonia-lyase [Paraburkholderia gardini]|uniref:Aspartate ammonia-lyase n=1 Tax=Paraburkholderia gardini TaxID=2823469 RepID=A0ABN7QMA8_9BURK|nr:aspartate ammonia-lyase [Paraburkholderia gardini]CAG4893697.1 Aspartate ammonia-lyase [Paraburkholderia gardini]